MLADRGAVWSPEDSYVPDELIIRVNANGQVSIANLTKNTEVIVRNAYRPGDDDGGRRALVHAIAVANILDVDVRLHPSLIDMVIT